MAHFAEIDENNIVKQVIVINDADTSDANGVEKEYIGAGFVNHCSVGHGKKLHITTISVSVMLELVTPIMMNSMHLLQKSHILLGF